MCEENGRSGWRGSAEPCSVQYRDRPGGFSCWQYVCVGKVVRVEVVRKRELYFQHRQHLPCLPAPQRSSPRARRALIALWRGRARAAAVPEVWEVAAGRQPRHIPAMAV